MSLAKIHNTITSYLFIIYSEKYNNITQDAFVERYVAKHPLLKPELIVVNDQLHGFKKTAKRLSSLEELPIFLEIEGVIEEELYYIDSFDLYCETNLNCQKRLIDMIYLTNLFSNYVKVERNIDVSNPKKESLVISSKLQELLLNSDIEGLENLEAQLTSLESSSHNSITSVFENSEDIEFKEIFIDLNQFNLLLTEHLKFFVEFIKLLHDLLIKNKPIDKLKKDCEAFFSKESE